MLPSSTVPPTHRQRDPHVAFPASLHRHGVQFFEDEEFLFGVVADFLASGLSQRQSALVIATAEHQQGFLRELRARAIDTALVLDTGPLVLLDARRTLDGFMVAGMPDQDRFTATIEPVVERLIAGREGTALCAYGEMVDLLWRDGNPAAAIRLEELWNGLARRHRFSLLCAYGIANFRDSADTEPFLEICRLHDHVVPTERYTTADDAARLVEISALQQRAQALENELERRTQLESELREALARAEEANRAKREFLGVMSHELRTPLNAIGGYVELLQLGLHGPVTEAQLESLRRIHHNGGHLLHLVDQVLLFAQAESGKAEFDIRSVDVAEVLRMAEACVEPQMWANQLAYACAGTDPPAYVQADPQKLRQILVNLLGNAIKFTEPGGRISIACSTVGDRVKIEVRDTGIGIPPEKLDLIFDPFTQVDGSATRTRGGVGMGLAISRALAHGMGGELAVASTVGAGTAFTLTLRGGRRAASARPATQLEPPLEA